MPGLAATPVNTVISTLRNPAEAFQVLSNGVVLTGQVRFEEGSAGRGFGTVFRFTSDKPLPEGIVLDVAADSLVDDAGNGSLVEKITLAAGTTAYAGPAAGSTATSA